MKDYSAMDDGAINMLVGESLGLTSYYLNHDCSVQFRNEKGHIKGTKNYCNNPADAWPLLLRIVESGVILNIGKNEINGDALNGKSIARKITELYLGLRSD